MSDAMDTEHAPPVEGEVLAPGLIHEMRHPLTGIRAGLQLVERVLGARVTALEEWGLVMSQLARLEEMFSRYEEFLHPEQAAASVYLVQPVVRAAVELLRYRLRALGPRFTITLPEEPVRAFGLPRTLVHALVNLLVNALDALEAAGGEGRLAVRVLSGEPGGSAEVRVSDEGIGVPPEIAARLFEPGFTTKSPGRGGGLGLSLARRLLAAHGAALELVPEGEPDRLPWARTELRVSLASRAMQL